MKIEEYKGEITKAYYITPKGYAMDAVRILTSFQTLPGGPIVVCDTEGNWSEAEISWGGVDEKAMSETSSEDAAKALAEALLKAIELKDKLDKEHGVGKFTPK